MTDATPPPGAPGAPRATHDGERPCPPVDLVEVPAWGPYALAIHGGAGPRATPLTAEETEEREGALRRALRAGADVLAADGEAIDAVAAAVVVLEDCAFFNAGRGAALTTDGVAELDACVMRGDRAAGAITAAGHARNPVRAARAVMDHTPHVLLVDPSPDRLETWGCELADQDWFRVPRQERALARLLEERRHGTVGAVARDVHGHVAAATSTGGITGQLPGRVGDTPLVGAGTFADDAHVAISGTGTGEFFVRGVLAHDLYARMRYAGADLATAARGVLDDHLGRRGADGGLVAVTPDGDVVLAWDSGAMYRGWLTADGPVAHA
ncbi:isoaspartyl peptidase/L-asparaginase family protein [Mobilicoccus pelagius]|uniref:Isoaspartyl peptidase n=1 Tax=Mobilicoccus pelagius NBRC 104925 TaxID=1089455 RepID=H5UR69_9MICO|nr:isoaspartyl peptidase/L-asparaginase [Mobilicoccus pelagius]GAB48227.1 isoaspartyl peptidase [Mobilicoccus pelagius NBRC 104925]